ncbi:PREDICTED: uncharacterized protein LOC108967558 [Bactrocera latifrons]|uniref:uncharacterized protein LOC108967558 n=1 Tax=Bactrocera latifrons TaxID=174628 RepID=UPI0008DD637B|nr:PREDICTED: uncharacterized protein LOC108967558 [Bactrocera latifrons]
MTCTEILHELQCKTPPCPCQKCAKLRGESGNGNVNAESNVADMPPERPIPKYQFQCKCLCETDTERPYKRKCPPAPPQPKQTVSPNKKCVEDDCNTGKGCCNTGRNFLSFMISIIGFISFLIIAAIVFWLLVLKCTIILSIKVYKSKRTTQVTVVSIIGFLFLLIFCTAALTCFQRYSARRSASKLAAQPAIKIKSEPSGSWYTFKRSQRKTIAPPSKVTKTRYPWTLRSVTPGSTKELTSTVSKVETRSSWMPFGRGREVTTKDIKIESSEPRSSWIKTHIWRETTTKDIVTPVKKPEASSSWLPSFRWSSASTKQIEQQTKTTETRTSWMPSRWLGQSPPKEIDYQLKKSEMPTSGLSTIRWRTKQPEQAPKKIERRFSWRPSSWWGSSAPEAEQRSKQSERRSLWRPSSWWGQSPSKEIGCELEKPGAFTSWISTFRWSSTSSKQMEPLAKKAEARTSWMPFQWGQTVPKVVERNETSVTRYTWLPSFKLRQSPVKIETTTTKTEARSSWLPSFNLRSRWTTYFTKSTTIKEIQTPPQTSKVRFSWMPFLSWSNKPAKGMEIELTQKEHESRSSWIPYFNWRRTKTTKTATTNKDSKKTTSTSYWWPSFSWGQSATTATSNRLSGGMQQQKLTVTITDDEARQIYKRSKLYAIPTEMKQPPALVVYLRDFIQRNAD